MKTNCLSDLELSTLQQHLEKRPYPFALAFTLWSEAGLRLNESRSLAWSDLIYEHKPLTELRLQAHATKSNRIRTLPINRVLADRILNAWRHYAQPKNFAPAHYALAKTADRDPVSARTLQRHLQTLSKTHTGREITPHVLRHTFATRLLRVSNIMTVKEALGHSSVITTQRYTHVTSEDVKNGVDRICDPPSIT